MSKYARTLSIAPKAGKSKPPATYTGNESYKRSGKKQTNNNFLNNDTFETKFTRHVSVVQRPSSVESRIILKLHLNL